MFDDILRDIIQNTYNRHIPSDVEIVERNGYIFFRHPRRCYDPLTLASIAFGVGTVAQIGGTLQQGKDANEIAKARAAVDIENAEAVDKAADEEAKIRRERGRRLIEEQKSEFAAGGVRINVGAPLVIEAETNAAVTRDIGFALKRGRAESAAFKASAALEIAGGKAAKKRSRQRALAQGILGFGSIAFMAASVPGAGGTSTRGTTSTTEITRFGQGRITRNFPRSAF